jgi:hypothetical protein
MINVTLFSLFFSLSTYYFTKILSFFALFGIFQKYVEEKAVRKHKNLRPKKGPESGYVSAKASWRRINMQGCSLSTKHQSKKDRERVTSSTTLFWELLSKMYLRQISILAGNE